MELEKRVIELRLLILLSVYSIHSFYLYCISLKRSSFRLKSRDLIRIGLWRVIYWSWLSWGIWVTGVTFWWKLFWLVILSSTVVADVAREFLEEIKWMQIFFSSQGLGLFWWLNLVWLEWRFSNSRQHLRWTSNTDRFWLIHDFFMLIVYLQFAVEVIYCPETLWGV